MLFNSSEVMGCFYIINDLKVMGHTLPGYFLAHLSGFLQDV